MTISNASKLKGISQNLVEMRRSVSPWDGWLGKTDNMIEEESAKLEEDIKGDKTDDKTTKHHANVRDALYIATSLDEMQGDLRLWDDAYGEVTQTLEELKKALPEITGAQVDVFRAKRDKLLQGKGGVLSQVQKNIEGSDKWVGGALRGTAIAGIGIPLLYFGGGVAGVMTLFGTTLTLADTAFLVGGGALIGGAALGGGNLVGQVNSNLYDKAHNFLLDSRREWLWDWDLLSDSFKTGAVTGSLAAGAAGLLRLGWKPYLRHPIQNLMSDLGILKTDLLDLAKTLQPVQKWIQKRWWARWAPAWGSALWGTVRTESIRKKSEAKSLAERKKVPQALLDEVGAEKPPTLARSLEIIEDYPYAKEEVVLPLMSTMFHQVVTPEGANIIAHALLETFSLSSTLLPEDKEAYVLALTGEMGKNEEPATTGEFDKAMKEFGKWVVTLGATGALESEPSIYSIDKDGDGKPDLAITGFASQDRDLISKLDSELPDEKEQYLFRIDIDGDGTIDTVVAGHVIEKEELFPVANGREEVEQTIVGKTVSTSIESYMEDLRREKEAVLAMVDHHHRWLGITVNDAVFLESLAARRKVIENDVYRIEWTPLQYKLGDLPRYLERNRKAFVDMVKNFDKKNPTMPALFWSEAAKFQTSGSGNLGFLSAFLFLENNWTVFFKGFVFMYGANMIEASYKAEDKYQERKPIPLCLPGYGTLCEQSQMATEENN